MNEHDGFDGSKDNRRGYVGRHSRDHNSAGVGRLYEQVRPPHPEDVDRLVAEAQQYLHEHGEQQ